MKLHLTALEITCKRAIYRESFARFTYFHGEMGAGKTTIASLINYCFGGNLDLTPALQSEFIEAALELELDTQSVRLERTVGANQVRAIWGEGHEAQQLIVPARVASGELIPNTGVENLSDLLFYLFGLKPPKIRRSRQQDSSSLQRLSFRDLFTFCYLDQDHIDSSFFNLDGGADYYRRLRSRAVLSYLLGYNQQRVAELEAELDEVRSDRHSTLEAAVALEGSLKDAGVESDLEMEGRLQRLKTLQLALEAEVETVRQKTAKAKTHVTEEIADRARQLVSEIQAVRDAITEVEKTLTQHRRHQNELLSLNTKFQRVTAARAVLNGLEFECCPRCTQPLPQRKQEECVLCGLPDTFENEHAVTATESDVAGRNAELNEVIEVQQEQLRRLRLREMRLVEDKVLVDAKFAVEMRQYDSMYLAQALDAERQLAAVIEEARFLERLRVLPAKVESLKKSVALLLASEDDLKVKVREARQEAEKDLTNVRVLGELFLDCLVRSKIPGFTSDDIVAFSSPMYFPEVMDRTSGDAAISSFDTLSSGGKKTLFKACFAVAVHRLAHRLGSILPTLLIIDSPMKNISERENRTQFEGFHAMLYDLTKEELSDVQFIMIDKEYCAPPSDLNLAVRTRHMKVDSDTEPPLIEYYRERFVEGSDEAPIAE